MKRFIGITMSLLILLTTLTGYAQVAPKRDIEIVFADAGWDSARFHNAVAAIIAENVYGYTTRDVTGGSTILHEGLLKGEIDVHMEIWTDNIISYDQDVKDGKLKEVGLNYNDNNQGFYVPRYMVEGDSERGIKALAPDLKSVADIKKYKDLFIDAEDSSKGRIYGAIPGWEVDTIMYNKFMYHGLDEEFIYFRPGSDAALSSAFTSAYEKGEPIVGYYWEPTWLMGKYEFILLEDAPYDENTYKEGKTALPSVDVTIATSNKFYESNKEYVEFLGKYNSSSELTSLALSHMQDTGDDYRATAIWFLTGHDELIDEWLEPEEADILRLSLGSKESTKINWLRTFPFVLDMNLEAIDDSVRDFSIRFDSFFGAIRKGLTTIIISIQRVLDFIPWWIMIILISIAGWRVSGKIVTGVLYGFMLFIVGAMGLWSLMNETLSIVITSVIISLILGFPIGILISANDRADRIIRPILDTMQTMPVFVYLIPALLFFGLGKAPAVIATTIYAIVPIIRLTSHGIKQIDEEIIEASRAFGSTYMQSLIKVQIPQALPTIMAGVNQTMMLAMAMVVTTSMIGASGLGMEVLNSVNRIEIGRGLVSGTAVVIIAVLMDRLTQGSFKNKGGNGHGR